MGIYVGNSEIKSVYIGTTPVKEVYVGTTKIRPTCRTFTISFTETTQMKQPQWRSYSDDASGLTAGSTAFDEFFGYSAVRLNGSGVETASITQAQSGGAGKLDITQLGTLTSGDNVMIKFPVRGIKMSKSGNTITLSITDGLNRESEGYQYYAHCRGTLSNPGTPKDAFYLGAYKGYSNSNVLKSWSGKKPTTTNQQNMINFARANDGNSGTGGYDICGFYQRMYINALYMMKYGCVDSQSTIGLGKTQGGNIDLTGQTNSSSNATYGDTNSGVHIKLFGVEDLWGNVEEWLGGVCTDASKKLYTALKGFVGSVQTSGTYENTGVTASMTSTYYCISHVAGNNKGMFVPIATVDNSSYNTYYCDQGYVAASSLVYVGGDYMSTRAAGIFMMLIAGSSVGARLMYL